MGKFVDLTGKKFERLEVICRVDKPTSYKRDGVFWKCLCECGNEVIMHTNHLTRKTYPCKSCGCYGEEAKKNRIIHGDTRVGNHEKLYNVWSSMKGRCYTKTNTSYNRYGALGIRVCKEWRESYEVFKEWALSNGYAKGLTLDRKDGKGDYQPSNCRWVTMLVQNHNRKNTIRLEYKGVVKTLSEWAKEFGIKAATLEARINHYKWPAEKSLETPIRHTKPENGANP